MNEVRLFKNLRLYRSDLEYPPTEWSADFKNKKYDGTNKGLGHKNKANMFFFTDSENSARLMAKSECIEVGKLEYYLTTTYAQNVKLIDFINRNNIYQMLCLLKDIDIDVLVSDFKTYNDNQIVETFSKFKSYFDLAETNPSNKVDIVKNIITFDNNKNPNWNVMLFGQRLTDFDNGILFRKLIQNKYPDIDGYMWKEDINYNGITYCLFDSKKLDNNKKVIVCNYE